MMKHILLIILLLAIAGLSDAREYLFVNTPMRGNDAEAYCNNVFGTNLATVITDADKTAAINAYNADGGSSTDLIWNGLVRDGNHDWHWIDGTECSEASSLCTPENWWLNTGENSNCGVFHYNNAGALNDWYCDDENSQFTFLCNRGPREYVFVNTPMRGNDAESYCNVVFGTNLATVISDDDRTAAINAFNGYDGSSTDKIWNGLVRDGNRDWHWIDGTECSEASRLCTPENWWLNTADNSNCGIFHTGAQSGDQNDWYCDDENWQFTFLCNARLGQEGLVCVGTDKSWTIPKLFNVDVSVRVLYGVVGLVIVFLMVYICVLGYTQFVAKKTGHEYSKVKVAF